MYIRILENDDWIVEYDIENNIYRVGYFQDNHFVDEVLFGTCETKMNKIVERLKELEEEHPYKVIGQPDTYSQYNEAWQDCIDRVLDIVKRGGSE